MMPEGDRERILPMLTSLPPIRTHRQVRPRAAASPRRRAPAGRRVLLAVAGLSPQVVTETLYALARREPPALPTEVHILTTAEGADRARLTLLGRDPGWFGRVCRECGLGRIQFGEGSIHVLHDAEGCPLADIRTPEENTLLADQLTELVRAFTADAATQLHVSIAGGRKTMGFYAGYALSLFGREQDRLSHVLVSPPFESHPDFFYPAARRRTIYDRDRRPLDAATAQVTLAEIPFVRMRTGMPRRLIEGRSSFGATVEALNQAQAPLQLHLDPRRRRVVAGACALQLPHGEMAFYLWLARRRVQGLPAVACPWGQNRELAAEYLAEYRRVRPDAPRGSGPVKNLSGGMAAEFFLQTKAKLGRHLGDAGVAAAYQVHRTPGLGRAGEFALELPAKAIVIDGTTTEDSQSGLKDD